MSEHFDYDLIVIGGGINGTAIAADASGRGLKTGLFEMNDLASATSSASSKLIHGGLRYLEHHEFRLVSEALAEREVMLKNAPHLVSPLRFVLPHRPHLRPAWLIRLGLFLYDHLGKRVTLPGSHGVRFDDNSPFKPEIQRGFEYSDCFVDDARLVVSYALAARDRGAEIHTRTKCLSAAPVSGNKDNGWRVHLENETGDVVTKTCRVLVNAAGPWINQIYQQQLQQPAPKSVRMVKGSHIVVPRLYTQKYACILQNEDNRIVFVIPYQNDFSLIGTTDVDYQGDPAAVAIDKDETDYLCDVVNQHLRTRISPADVVHSWSGVRPLISDDADNAQEVTRDYSLELHHVEQSHLLSVFGGKITTSRKLGEAAADKLSNLFPNMGPAWTKDTPLPGGDMPDREALAKRLRSQAPWLSGEVIQRWQRAYGSRSELITARKNYGKDPGIEFGHGLYQAEVDYLVEHEWAQTAEDILWRRTRLGLRFNPEQTAALERYLADADKEALRQETRKGQVTQKAG